MKRIISVTTAAVMTAAIACVPMSMVSAATITDAFTVSIPDMSFTAGETSVKIPVSFTGDVSFVTASLQFSAEAIFSKFKPEIVSIESALPDTSGVSFQQSNSGKNTALFNTAGDKDFTLKKGETLLYLNIKVPAETVSGTKMKISIQNMDIANAATDEYEFSDNLIKESYGYLFAAAKKTEGMTAKIGEVESEKTIVEVPIYINGGLNIINSLLKVDNGAKITAITATDPDNKEGFMGAGINTAGTSDPEKIVWVKKGGDGDYAFSGDAAMANITVELPGDLKSGDEFNISFRYFDCESVVTPGVYPAEITSGKITYTGEDVSVVSKEIVEGSYEITEPSTRYYYSYADKFDLSGLDVTARVKTTYSNGTEVFSTVNLTNFISLADDAATPKTTYKSDKFLYNLDLELNDADLKAEGVKVGSVNALIGMKGDINLDHTLTTIDATVMLKENAANQFGSKMLPEVFERDSVLEAGLTEAITADDLYNFACFLADTNSSGELETLDAVYAMRYNAAKQFANPSTWDEAAEWSNLVNSK